MIVIAIGDRKAKIAFTISVLFSHGDLDRDLKFDQDRVRVHHFCDRGHTLHIVQIITWKSNLIRQILEALGQTVKIHSLGGLVVEAISRKVQFSEDIDPHDNVTEKKTNFQ